MKKKTYFELEMQVVQGREFQIDDGEGEFQMFFYRQALEFQIDVVLRLTQDV
jgi:hypothetical protein